MLKLNLLKNFRTIKSHPYKSHLNLLSPTNREIKELKKTDNFEEQSDENSITQSNKESNNDESFRIEPNNNNLYDNFMKPFEHDKTIPVYEDVDNTIQENDLTKNQKSHRRPYSSSQIYKNRNIVIFKYFLFIINCTL
jgi:hypothetical protein